MAENSRVHVWVKGRVQAVGFRAFVQQNATLIGVSGWVRNVGYNTVEAVAEGERERLDQFIQMMERGPVASNVDESRKEWEIPTGEFQSFNVRRSM